MVRFTITIYVDAPHLTGLEAIDYCRARGVEATTGLMGGFGQRSCNVDEAFARLYFSPTQCERSVRIPAEAFMPGELELKDSPPGSGIEYIAMCALEDSRIKELFVSDLIRDFSPES